MLPIGKIILAEALKKTLPSRVPEPFDVMDDLDQVKAYIKSYEWGGPTSALMLHHLRELSLIIRPGDVILDLACGPGSLLLELAALYPECHFIGADLSENMLHFLQMTAQKRGLNNVAILKEDICKLPSLEEQTVDVIISTSALHHLPDDNSLRVVFSRCKELLKSDGGYYFFDFSLLKSEEAKKLFVAEVAKLAQPITVRDYDLSLKAAFPFRLVYEYALKELPKPFTISRSAFVNFFYIIQSGPRGVRSVSIKNHMGLKWKQLSLAMKMEHLMLRFLRKKIRIRL